MRKTTKKFVEEMKKAIREGKKVSLSLENHWWVKRECSPWEGEIVPDAIRFSEDLTPKEVVNAIEAEGLTFKEQIPMCFGYVRKSKKGIKGSK